MSEIFIRNSLLSQYRLNVVQTEFGQNVSFQMRTFRFITAGSSSSEAQNQTIACNLHLDPIVDVTSDQPDDCSCHTEADCATPATPGIYHIHLKNSLIRLERNKSLKNSSMPFFSATFIWCSAYVEYKSANQCSNGYKFQR